MKRDTKVTLVSALATGAISVITAAFGIWSHKQGLDEGYEIGLQHGRLEGVEYGSNMVNEARDEQEEIKKDLES